MQNDRLSTPPSAAQLKPAHSSTRADLHAADMPAHGMQEIQSACERIGSRLEQLAGRGAADEIGGSFERRLSRATFSKLRAGVHNGEGQIVITEESAGVVLNYHAPDIRLILHLGNDFQVKQLLSTGAAENIPELCLNALHQISRLISETRGELAAAARRDLEED